MVMTVGEWMEYMDLWDYRLKEWSYDTLHYSKRGAWIKLTSVGVDQDLSFSY